MVHDPCLALAMTFVAVIIQWFRSVENWSGRFPFVGNILLLLGIGYLDYMTGPNATLGILYLVPVSLVAWQGNKRSTVMICLLAAGAGFVAEAALPPVGSHAAVNYWNFTARLGAYGFVAMLLLVLRQLNTKLECAFETQTERLRQETHEHARAEENIQAIVRSAVDAILTINDEGRITEFNPAAEKMFGYTRAEVMGRLMAEAIVPPASAELSPPNQWSTSNDRFPPPMDEPFGLSAIRADGTEFPIELILTRIGIAAQPTFMVIARDLSERIAAEKRDAVFANLAHRLSAASRPEAAARIIMDMALDLYGWDAGYLHLYSPTADEIVPILTIDTFDGRRVPVDTASFTMDPSPLMRRIMSEGAQLVNRPMTLAPTDTMVPFGSKDRLCASMMYVPIRTHGTVLGVLSIQSYTPRAYTRNDLKLLQALADHCGDGLERIRLTEALRDRERTLRLIATNATDLIYAADLNDRPVYANQAAEEVTGRTFGEIQEKGFLDCVHPDDRDRMFRHRQDLCAGKPFVDVEFRIITKTGRTRWLSSTWGLLLDESGHPIGSQGRERDVTKLKQLEIEILDISAQEQRRIGHELHDGLGQHLTGIALRSKCLKETLLAEGTPHADEVGELVQLTNSAIAQTRWLARGLDPIHLQDDDLGNALRKLAAEIEKLFLVVCQVQTTLPRISLLPAASMALYRIAQQAATNAVQHGHARNLTFQLHADDTFVSLRIVDDGSGFNVDEANHQGLGLRIMQYRARSVGGSLTVQSRPNHGTNVLCCLPVNDPSIPQHTIVPP